MILREMLFYIKLFLLAVGIYCLCSVANGWVTDRIFERSSDGPIPINENTTSQLPKASQTNSQSGLLFNTWSN